jgi:hypothetical protein
MKMTAFMLLIVGYNSQLISQELTSEKPNYLQNIDTDSISSTSENDIEHDNNPIVSNYYNHKNDASGKDETTCGHLFSLSSLVSLGVGGIGSWLIAKSYTDGQVDRLENIIKQLKSDQEAKNIELKRDLSRDNRLLKNYVTQGQYGQLIARHNQANRLIQQLRSDVQSQQKNIENYSTKAQYQGLLSVVSLAQASVSRLFADVGELKTQSSLELEKINLALQELESKTQESAKTLTEKQTALEQRLDRQQKIIIKSFSHQEEVEDRVDSLDGFNKLHLRELQGLAGRVSMLDAAVKGIPFVINRKFNILKKCARTSVEQIYTLKKQLSDEIKQEEKARDAQASQLVYAEAEIGRQLEELAAKLDCNDDVINKLLQVVREQHSAQLQLQEQQERLLDWGGTVMSQRAPSPVIKSGFSPERELLRTY